MGRVGVPRSREECTALALQALHSAWYIRTCEPKMTWQVTCQGNSTQTRAHGGCRIPWAGERGVGPLAQLTVLFIPSSNSDPFPYPCPCLYYPHLECSSIPPTPQAAALKLFPHCQSPCYERQTVGAAVLIRVPPPPTPAPQTGGLVG